MSYIPFHKWGAQNNDQTQNIINGVKYGATFVSTGEIESGECLFYTYQTTTYSFKKNPNYASGNWGCFSDETAFIAKPDTEGGILYPRYWLTGNGTADGKVKDGTTANNAYALGVGVNTTNDANDFIAVQSAGVCQIAWDDTSSNVDIGVHVTAASAAGKIERDGTSAATGSMGITANVGSAGSSTGYIWVRLNLVELFSDVRLKENIEHIGRSNKGINIYKFEFKNKKYGKGIYCGALAQDVPKDALIKTQDKYYKIDYSKLDVYPAQLMKQNEIS